MLVLDTNLLKHRPIKHQLPTDHERECARLLIFTRGERLRQAPTRNLKAVWRAVSAFLSTVQRQLSVWAREGT